MDILGLDLFYEPLAQMNEDYLELNASCSDPLGLHMSSCTPPYDGSEHDVPSDKIMAEDKLFYEIDLSESQDKMEKEDAESCGLSHCSSRDELYSPTRDTVDDQENSQNLMNKTKKQSQTANALMARRTRERKKKYIQDLECKVESLRKDKGSLEEENNSMKNAMKKLTNEVQYLRNVLANQSDLSKILRAVAGIPEMTISPTVKCVPESSSQNLRIPDSRKRPSDSENDSSSANAKKLKNDGGICLHVSNGSVSLELCAECNKSSLNTTDN